MGRKARKNERRKIENEFLRDRYIGKSAAPGVHDFVIVLEESLSASVTVALEGEPTV